MTRPASPPKAIFLHVPKTGGTTFREVMRQAYPDFAGCSNPSVDAIARMLDEHGAVEIVAADAREGGTVFGNRELMREENWGVLREVAVFVMFRDPVEFVRSLHQHVGRSLDQARVRGAYAEHPDALGVSLEEFVANPLHANLQLAFLLGELPLRTGRPLDEADLARGLRMLDALDFHVGVTERYPQMLQRFEHVTGTTIPGREVTRRNASPALERALDPALRRRIAEANALDVALHRHALAIVEREAAALGPLPDYVFTDSDPAVPGG